MRYLLRVVCVCFCRLFVVCFVFDVVRSSLFVACCVLFVVGCVLLLECLMFVGC